MHPFQDQDHYELLEVPRSGTPQQIERAYRIARMTYQPASTATYSVFNTEEAAAILRAIEEAYAILSDARLRREYDARLRWVDDKSEIKPDPPRVVEHASAVEKSAVLERAPVVEKSRNAEPRSEPRLPVRPKRAEMSPEVELDESLEPADGVYDGPVLRRIRMSLGIEIEEICALTKVNEVYLNSLEANEYASLPAKVYVRGFVKEFAKCIGLDAVLVADSYIRRLEAQAGVRG